MDGLSLLPQHMYRSKSYGFIVAHFKDIQYTDSELGDSSCQILQGPTWAVRECSHAGEGIPIITRMKVEWFKKQRLLIIQLHITPIPY
jgi:hypothetical protein